MGKKFIALLMAAAIMLTGIPLMAATASDAPLYVPKTGLYVQTPVVDEGARLFAYENLQYLGWAEGGDGGLVQMDIGIIGSLKALKKRGLPMRLFADEAKSLSIGQGFICYTSSLKKSAYVYFPVLREGQIFGLLVYGCKGDQITNMASPNYPDLYQSIGKFNEMLKNAALSETNPLFFYEVGGICAISKDKTQVYVIATGEGKTQEQVKAAALAAHAKRIKRGNSMQKEELSLLTQKIAYAKAYEIVKIKATAAVNKKALEIAAKANWPVDGMQFAYTPDENSSSIQYKAERALQVEGLNGTCTLTYVLSAKNNRTTTLRDFAVWVDLRSNSPEGGSSSWIVEKGATLQSVLDEIKRLQGLGAI